MKVLILFTSVFKNATGIKAYWEQRKCITCIISTLFLSSIYKLKKNIIKKLIAIRFFPGTIFSGNVLLKYFVNVIMKNAFNNENKKKPSNFS